MKRCFNMSKKNMNKILQYISIAAKAGKVFGGEMQTESRIRSESAKIVIVAEDASDNTKNRIIKLAEHSGIPVVTVPDRESLGQASGRDFRSSVVITDRGLADAILRCRKENTPREGNF